MNDVNVFTKQDYDSDFSKLDLCSGLDINPVVKHLYYQYKEDCNKLAYHILQGEHGSREYYVYAWHTVQLPKRYFYVGKGTGKRYKHILKEISKYKSGEKKRNPRYKQYSIIQDSCGIECEFLLKDLTEYEALIYEQCVKLDFWNNGEVLLNVEGVIDENELPDGWRSQGFTNYPSLENNRFNRRYLDCEAPKFDVIEFDSLLNADFYNGYFESEHSETIEKQNKLIEMWITHSGGKISSCPKSLIVQGLMPEHHYHSYKKDNVQIYSAEDVLTLIKHDNSFSISLSDIILEPPVANQELLNRMIIIADYIKQKLIELGADEKYIFYEEHREKDVLLGITAIRYLTRYISFFVYKKRNLNYILVPLSLADDTLQKKLTKITSWKGHFEFVDTAELEALTNFFNAFIEEAEKQRDYYHNN